MTLWAAGLQVFAKRPFLEWLKQAVPAATHRKKLGPVPGAITLNMV